MEEVCIVGKLPILALRGITVFPEQSVHFDIGREKSAMALEAAMKKDQILFLAPQKDIEEDNPGLSGLLHKRGDSFVSPCMRSFHVDLETVTE